MTHKEIHIWPASKPYSATTIEIWRDGQPSGTSTTLGEDQSQPRALGVAMEYRAWLGDDSEIVNHFNDTYSLGQVCTRTLDEVETLYRQGLVTQWQYEEYYHYWYTSSPRIASEACRCWRCAG